MDYNVILAQVLALLQEEKRLSYRVLKLRLQLDDDALEALKEDLIYAKHLAIDEDGKVLVWVGGVAPQADQTRLASTAPPASRAPEAERRQLTVLFCDLVDSTALAARLDPEELREVVRAYQDACAEVIGRFEGHIAQYLGDGLLVYFGYPLAHEDDAPRAVRAGLGLVEAIGRLNARLQRDKGVSLAVRLGIHTGLVVVGEMGGGVRHVQLALGETPNLAARLQGLAEPDTVVISGATYRLVQGLFVCQALGVQTLKGVPQPVAVCRVLGESEAHGRLEAAGPSGLTPLVGREQEVGLLVERWQQAKEGLGQVVLLSGEAGIGKSRLVQVVKERVAGEPHPQWECRCSPYHQNSALYPVIDLMQRMLQLQREDSPEARLDKLESALAPYDVSLAEVVPLFASLLSIPLPDDRYPPLALTPQRQKQKTQEAVLAVLLALATRQPVLFIVEDLHWVDPSTLELLSFIIDQVPTARILTLFVFRPEFRPPWAPRLHLTQLTLSRLPRHQTEVMVERVAGGKALPGEVVQQVVAKTDGVPLFVEELTKTMLESGLLREGEDGYELMGPLPPLAIPATLHDSLMARLDRLATVKEVAQLGATLGRAFPYDLLRAVSPLDEATLQHALAQLVEAELLYQRGLPPQATYLFKHALIQDAAYQSLLKSRRQQHHQHIAQVLEARFPELCETQPELLAHHYTAAGLTAQAIPYWQRAGERAIQRSANVEAISQLTTALALLSTLPDTPERAQQELDAQIALGIPLVLTKGHAAPEVETTYARARALCQQLGDTPQLFSVLLGLRRFYFMRGELRTAHELGEQLLRLAGRLDDRGLLVRAHMMLVEPLLYLGEFAQARAHAAQGIALYDPQQHRAQAFRNGNDPGVCCRSFAAQALWVLGYPDQALRRSDEALAWAQELAHPFSLGFALHQAAYVHQFRREGALTQARAEAAIALSTEQGFALWLALGPIVRGWALAAQGQAADGLAQIRQDLAAWRAIEAHPRPYGLALLAGAYGKVGQPEEGLRVLTEAQTAAQVREERILEAELSRLKGELLLAQSSEHHAAAETCFQQALAVARCQQAKSWELRTATSLSRLWQRQGKRAEAHELLAPIYDWFTEGFDTADLQEAKALLEELS